MNIYNKIVYGFPVSLQHKNTYLTIIYDYTE
jgi:hypothetical protein